MATATGGRRGRPSLFSPADLAFLVEQVKEQPQATTRELAVQLSARTGRYVPFSTVGSMLRRQGVQKVRPTVVPRDAASHGPVTKRYGYTEMHRRESGDRYASSVTDVEWELVRDLFERKGPGRPEQYSRRVVFDAVSYVVRSGCALRMLPKDFPPWPAVYATFRRWSDAKLFEQMHDRLRGLWREREGRLENPTASVLDSQSVRTAEKGGSTVTTPARRSRAASVTSVPPRRAPS